MRSWSDPGARWPARLFQLGMALLLGLALWQCRHGWPVSFDVMALAPTTAQSADDADPGSAALRQLAEARVQEPLSRQLLALVMHADPDDALASARWLAARWRASGLFAQVELEINVDVAALRAALREQRLALLPAEQRQLLLHDPQAYLTQRAAQLADPFSSTGLVPLSQDWLGLAQYAQTTLAAMPESRLYLNLTHGVLQTETAQSTGILLRAHTHADAFDTAEAFARDPRATLTEQLAQDRATLAAAGAQLLLAGGPLYAAQGQEQAMREISRIGGAAALGIVLVLLLALRRVRALLALAPVLVGLFTGAVACVAVFGSIHVLTLVIGASLIGVAVDFPLHWLGKSYGMHPWQAHSALRPVLRGLSLSLAASLIGYLALLFTPFPALTQTAVFSAAGLLGAYACTLCQLPAWMRHVQPNPSQRLLRLARTLLRWRARLCTHPRRLALLAIGLALAATGGIQRLSLHDDLRQWLSLAPETLREAQQIGEDTGWMPTSQFFLVQAPDADTLLHRQAQLSRALDALVQAGDLGAYNALSQWLAPLDEQRAVQEQLARMAQQPELWQPLLALGIPWSALQAELHTVAQLPPLTLKAALQGAQVERWQPLWLGEHAGGVAAMVTLLNLRSSVTMHALAQRLDIPGVTLVDRSGELNQLFAATRVKAAELKLLSYLACALLLWWGLGRAAVLRVLAVPFLGVAASLAVLGWLGQPLTLFSLFGLLLVSALGVDYAIFMFEAVAGTAASLVSILLSAATTLLSFGLLALSQTPVVAGFGLSVALGVAFSLLFALWVRPPTPSP